MGEAVYHLHSEPSTHVEVIIHVTESLEEEQRDRLISGLEQDESIKSAEFCPLALPPHAGQL